MAEPPTFEQLAEFIRKSAAVSRKKPITPETQFERDLGITGDDGCELLEAVEKRFETILHTEEDGYRKTFNLGANEYLFHTEGGFFFYSVHAQSSLCLERNRSWCRAFLKGHG